MRFLIFVIETFTMNSSLSRLPPDKQESLQATIPLIKKTINPEKIILFGFYADNYDILVITRPDDTRQDFETQDILTNRCRSHGSPTFIVHDMKYVNQCLSSGQPFFYKIIKEGILLYDTGATPLADPEPPNFVLLAERARRSFQHWFHQAGGFLKCARYNHQLEEYRISMFVLHQATEHAYQAILIVLTGYGPKTHNLDKLRRYSNRFSEELANLFPCSTEEEVRLFKLLTNAYTDARYKGEYSLSGEQLRLLLERITRLHSIAERLCHDHFISLERHIEKIPA
jgi:uncharacterized protein